MRVGANVKQHARIRKLHGEGMPANFIAKSMNITDQSLEKILAHIDGRPEEILAVEENQQVQSLRLENADLLQRLAAHEEPIDGTLAKETEVESEDEVEAESKGDEG